MRKVEIQALPCDEAGILHLRVSASNATFSGLVEIYINPEKLIEFSINLMKFPIKLNHIVSFEYGNASGEYPYHLLFEAKTIDSIGHSALFVQMQSFASTQECAFAKFHIHSEVASLNAFGTTLNNWVKEPNKPLVWHPSA